MARTLKAILEKYDFHWNWYNGDKSPIGTIRSEEFEDWHTGKHAGKSKSNDKGEEND